MPGNHESELRIRAEATLIELGASAGLLAERDLPLFADAAELTVAHVSQSGCQHYLLPAAAEAWIRMREAAAASDVTLVMISGFRSFDRQRELIRAKLDAGQRIEDVLTVMAPPGCSEHHSGQAVDIGTPGCSPLSERFEATRAFHWLNANAASYGYRMSYPRGNRFGYLYEPWHWRHES